MNAIFDFSSLPTIDTERLHLRQIRHEDADAIMAIYSGDEMMRFLAQPPIDTREKAIGLIDWFSSNFQNQIGIDWGITLKGETELIGMGGAYGWNREDRKIDIGYHILTPYWGKGYATEATRAIIGWCFKNLDLHRIQADCTDGNIGSERVLLKSGFKVEGVWRESCWEHGRFVDIKQFGLLRREFESL
jgi:[ribosomal protein S5]-alanine N-acetyltransferase